MYRNVLHSCVNGESPTASVLSDADSKLPATETKTGIRRGKEALRQRCNVFGGAS